MAIIATICLLAAGIVIFMASAKFEYSQRGEVGVERKRVVTLCLGVVVSVCLMVICGVLWVSWEKLFTLKLPLWGHGLYLVSWFGLSYQAGKRLGRACSLKG